MCVSEVDSRLPRAGLGAEKMWPNLCGQIAPSQQLHITVIAGAT